VRADEIKQAQLAATKLASSPAQLPWRNVVLAELKPADLEGNHTFYVSVSDSGLRVMEAKHDALELRAPGAETRTSVDAYIAAQA
jgi:hypothetical protein